MFDPTIKVAKKKRRIKPKEQQRLKVKILELTLAGYGNVDIAKHPDVNLTVNEKTGHCQQVWRIQQELVAEGKLRKDPKSKRLVGLEDKRNDFKWKRQQTAVAQQNSKSLTKFNSWLDSKNDGKGDPQKNQWMNHFLTICNTVDVHPDEIAFAKDTMGNPAYFQKATEVMKQFVKLKTEGKLIRQSNYRTNSLALHSNDESGNRQYVMAIRQFLQGNDLHIPKVSLEHVLSGKKGKEFGAYNKIGLTDDQHMRLIEFAEDEATDYGFVGFIALMSEMITRTESLANWTIQFETEYDEFESMPVEYDFVKAFHETKTEKSKSNWDKFIINPKIRKILHELAKERKGKPLVDHYMQHQRATTKIESEVNRICREFYIKEGILDESTRLPRMIDKKRNPERKFYDLGTEGYFYDIRPAYVLRHTGAHTWCRRTKYDYGFVAELGWGDMNTLKQCYAGMDLRSMLRASMCMYCKPPRNADLVKSDLFCSATHAFIYYSNGCKPKSSHAVASDSDLQKVASVDSSVTNGMIA